MRAAFGLLVPLLLAACGARPEASDLWEISTIRKAKERGKLVVAHEAEFFPWEYVNEKGETVGFDVDLARELGRELGVKVEFHNVAWESIVLELTSGRADLIVSGMTTTAERALKVSYTQPYYEAVTCLLVSKQRGSDVKSIADLDREGRVVTVKTGTTGHTAAKARLKKAKVVDLPTENAAALEVAQGKADAFLYDLTSIRKQHEQYAETTFVIEDAVTVEPYAIACRKGDPETVAWLDLALSLMRRDGRLKELYARHGLAVPKESR